MKALSELTAPAEGVQFEARAAKKREREEEDEESR